MDSGRRARYSDPVFDNIQWAGMDEERECSVCLGCTLNWGQTYEFIRQLKDVPQGMMKWGNGRWRLLFSTRDQARQAAAITNYEWKGMTLVMRLVSKPIVKSIVKVKYFSVSELECQLSWCQEVG
jgi:hypothetical protein